MPTKGAQGQGGGPGPGIGAAGIGMNRIDRGGGEEGNKFNKVMDWGTPRLVTK